MKKRQLKSLRLNKKSISNLRTHLIVGGEDTIQNFNCRTSDESFCECNTDHDCTDTECHTVWDCEL